MKYTFFHDSYVKGSGIDPLRPSPCMSVDFFPLEAKAHRVATAVVSENVKIWDFEEIVTDQQDENLSLSFQLVAELTPSPECKTVNIVRWSPDGLLLATGCSSGHVLVWKRQRLQSAEERNGEAVDPALRPSEIWKIHKTFKNHDIDVLDLSWSPPMLDSNSGLITSLLTAVSFDNKISVVNIATGETVQELKNPKKFHKSPVQGCTWDPWGSFFVTQSCDRTVRIFSCNQRAYSLQVCNTKMNDENVFTPSIIMKKCEFSESQFLPKDKCSQENHKKKFLMFKEENPKIHNRRLDMSPDGSILVIPAAQFPNIQTLQDSGGKKVEFQDVILTFARNKWKSPQIVHPGHSYPVTCIRFSPVLYKKDKIEAGKLPYWMMFAAISKDKLVVYSTEHRKPIYVAQLMHQEMLTDVSWSSCGRLIFVSSWDGYFSVYKFEPTDIPNGYLLEKYNAFESSSLDSENINCHKALKNIKKAFSIRAENMTQLFKLLKTEEEKPAVKVLQVKRKTEV